MRKIMIVVLLLLGVAPLKSYGEELRIGGTGAGLALSRALAEAFLKQSADGNSLWMPESLGTSGGVKALAAGKLDVAVLMRALKPDEVGQGASLALCRTPWVFYAQQGRDDVALASADVTALYLSSLPAFAKGEVRPLLRPANETGFAVLQQHFPQLAPVIEQARAARGAVLAMTDQDAMDAVETGASLIGFGAYAPLVAGHRPLRAVALDGNDPSALTPQYPLWSTLYFATGQQTSALGRAFVAYAQSAAAAAVLRANGCLPTTAEH